LAREIAETFLSEAEREARMGEHRVARRMLGLTCFHQRHFSEAEENLVEGMSDYEPERDREARDHVFVGPEGAAARAFLALTKWPLGEVGPARVLIEEAVARAIETGHAPTLGITYWSKAYLEMVRGDAAAARRDADVIVKISRESALTEYAHLGALASTWADARLDNSASGMADLRQALAAYIGLGNKLTLPFFQGLLAEIEGQDATAGALTRIDEALALAGETGEHGSDAFLYRLRGELLLKRDSANVAQAEEAFLTAIAIAQEQKARSYELRAALSLARLYHSIGRSADAHDVLRPAVAGFSRTPECPEIAEAQAMLAALAETDEVKNAAASRQRRLKLQTSLGQALMWSRGYGTGEAMAAFIRARELTAATDNPTERLKIYRGLWVGYLGRGELAVARAFAETFLREAERGERTAERGIGHYLLGPTCFVQGDLIGAQANLLEALSTYVPKRDREARFRFGPDIGAMAKAWLAITKWLLGEVGPARALIEEAVGHAIETDHAATQAVVYTSKAQLEMVRGDAAAARRDAETVVRLSREKALSLYAIEGAVQSAWASARLDGLEAGATELRQTLAARIGQGDKLWVPFYQGLLAEIEAQADAARALTRIGEALALAGDTGQRWSDAFLHRLRGEILLKRDPANTAPAEDAFLTAIAIAHEQKARSFELRAALDLARLYDSTDRTAEARALLASALEGFLPTSEFPEIEKALALLATLAETDEVKNAAASRQRRLKLQTRLGLALMWSRGYGAEESRNAFVRAGELAAAMDNATERFTVYHGLIAGNLPRAELGVAREIAETFLREAEREALATECGVACRDVGATLFFQGDFIGAQSNFVEALSTYDPERDHEARFPFGVDTGAVVKYYLGMTKWLLGEVGPARELIDGAVAHAIETDHVPTIVNSYMWKAHFETVCGDAGAAGRAAETVAKLSQENALAHFATEAALTATWVTACLDRRGGGATEL
jgi:predicted ATPase